MATDSELKLGGDEEPKIPVFTVVKNGSLLKNIFIVNSCDHDHLNPTPSDHEQILIVGRHPDCNIMLTHPSVSRFHLQILSNPSLHKLCVIDLSSVHGTWVSEKRIDPWDQVELREGDSLRIGGSSRVYRLHWIPLSQAYDFDGPYESASDPPLTEEKEEVSMEAYQDENSLLIGNESVEEEENVVTMEMKAEEEESEGIQSASPVPENLMYSLFHDEQCIESSLKYVDKQKEVSRCDDGQFGTESGQFCFPFEGVILDSECAETVRDSQSLELSTVLGPEKEPNHLAVDSDISMMNEEKSDLAPALEETENQSLFIEDFGQSEVVDEIEKQHDYMSPSLTGKQENSKACYDEVPLVSERKEETEDQKLSLGHHGQKKEVLVEYHTPYMTETMNLSFAAEEDVQEISDDKENQTPQSLYAVQSETIGTSPMRPEKTPGFGSIWARRGKPVNVIQLRTSRSRGETSVDGVDAEHEQHNQENMEDKPISREVFSCLNGEEEENFTPNKENFTPNTLLLKSKSLKKKGKLASIGQLQRGTSGVKTMLSSVDSEGEQHSQENIEDKSISKELFSCLDKDEEEIFTPNKENFTPNTLLVRSLKKKGKLASNNVLQTFKSRFDSKLTSAATKDEHCNQKAAEDESVSKENFSCLDKDEEEIFTPNKENFTPNTLLVRSLKKKGKLASNNVLQTFKSGFDNKLTSAATKDERCNQKAAEDESVSKENFSCLDKDEQEIFTPDKEIFSPNTLLFKSLKKKKGKVEEAKHSKWYGSSFPRLTSSPSTQKEDLIASANKENQTLRVLQELKPVKQPISVKQVLLERESVINKRRQERVPFQSLAVNSGRKSISDTSGPSYVVKDTKNVEKVTNPLPSKSVREVKKSWTMVVDTTSLLKKESWKSLQLLQGLRGTRLIIPQMVIRELDCLKRHGSLFRRKTEACLVLEWIEQCMVENSWWIHVQSSAEDERLTAPTPPASPQSPYGQDSGGFFYRTTSSLPFVSHKNLMEIVSPTTEDHILECSLRCRKMMSEGWLVLLSDDVTLKIKAMAEGLICETGQEFRESLMNPFSERFLWVDSSPRGQTWSVMDDVVLREKYDRFPLKKSFKGESAKGLKLILLHNSHYGQRTLIS